MATDYNSKLIAKLYATTKPEEIRDIVVEMEEINDPIFVYPLCAALEKFKHTSIPHYILGALEPFTEEVAIDATRNFALDESNTITFRDSAFGSLIRNQIFEDRLVESAISAVQSADLDDIYYQVRNAIHYLQKNKSLEKVYPFLEEIIFSTEVSKSNRIYAVQVALEYDAKFWLRMFINNFDKVHANEDLEIVLSSILIKWKGTNVKTLLQLIESTGCSRAQEIIFKAKEKEKTQESINEKERLDAEATIFTNSSLIEELFDLRKKINFLAKNFFGSDLFPSVEQLIKQNRAPVDEAAFRTLCLDLRDIIGKFNSELPAAQQTDEDASKILPIQVLKQDYGKPINQLVLLLAAKELPVEKNLFGLRELNALLSKVGSHPTETVKDVFILLDKMGCRKIYEDQDWGKLHSFFLQEYKSILLKIEKMFNEGKKSS